MNSYVKFIGATGYCGWFNLKALAVARAPFSGGSKLEITQNKKQGASMNKNHISLLITCFITLLAWVASSSAQIVVFKDDFETPISDATYWAGGGDNDPDMPVVGTASWVVSESAPLFVQQVRHPQFLPGDPYPKPGGPPSSPSFAPAADGDEQYLHMAIGGSVWAPIDGTGQALMQSATALDLTTKIFGLSGHDTWRGFLSLTGVDNPAGAITTRAFDLYFTDGGYGVDGTVSYYDGTFHTIPGMTFKVNTWQDLTIQVDFLTDTFSVALNGERATGLTWAGGDLSKIQSILLTPYANPGRGGFDNFTIIVPEPAVASLVALGAMALLVRRRR